MIPRTERWGGRAAGELRPVEIVRGAVPYAEGSCRLRAGNTEVLCAATVQNGVPEWRRASGSGWLTAEYAMLPRSTHTRTSRERQGLGGRTQEIQRLIGRSLRATVDLSELGERTVLVDCDVLVADGGTRTASITGAAVALHDALAGLVASGHIPRNPMRELVAAVSVGIVGTEVLLDLDYREDSTARVDMNVVSLHSGGLVEVQGTAERGSYTRAELHQMLDLAGLGLERLWEFQRTVLAI